MKEKGPPLSYVQMQIRKQQATQTGEGSAPVMTGLRGPVGAPQMGGYPSQGGQLPFPPFQGQLANPVGGTFNT